MTSASLDGGSSARTMRLRYAGSCRSCAAELPAGTSARYDRATRTVQCLSCAAPSPPGEPVPPPPAARSTPPAAATADPVAARDILPGAAGASARREFERRKVKREDRVRAAHPKLGGLILAITDEPQTTTAWATGARGEEVLGRRLDGLTDRGVGVLHDRRIPPTKANIDHLAVTASGVVVIDAKRYKGRPHLHVEGGRFRPRVERLLVGTRDQTSLVTGAQRQVDVVRRALETAGLTVRVSGMLCFVDADWPLIDGSFVIDGIDVLWPRKAVEHLVEPGDLSASMRAEVLRALTAAFPPA